MSPCQASITAVLNIANNFSILIGQPKWEDQIRQNVYDYGYKDKLASFQSVGLGVEDFHKDPVVTREKLEAAAVEAVTIHKAESIILGCTLEIGFYEYLQKFLNGIFSAHIPVIDCSIASFKAAENAAMQKQFGWKNSRVWGMQPPPESELEKFDIFQTDYQFGNIINIPAT